MSIKLYSIIIDYLLCMRWYKNEVKDHLAEGPIIGYYLYELYIMDIIVDVMQIDTYEILR